MNIETVMPTASLQSIYIAMFCDAKRLSPSVHFDEDLKYLLGRIDREGIQFAITVLPLLGKAVESALILEEPLMVPNGWSLKKNTRLPKFLNSLFIQVFEEDGKLKPNEEVSVLAVRLIRQLTLAFSKVEGGIDTITLEKVIGEFIERTTRPVELVITPELIRARRILRNVFNSTIPQLRALREFQKKPFGKHGSGAVADKSGPSEKWKVGTWPGMPETLFRLICEDANTSFIYDRFKEQPIGRVVAVPKDFRGPRLICIEPKENMFAQQGLWTLLRDFLMIHPITKKSINFLDVSKNHRLCHDSNVATVDLKDASDMLSMKLAKFVLPRWLFSLVTRYRTRTIKFGGKSWNPNCLATMGNACCFPLETLVFWALAWSTVMTNRNVGDTFATAKVVVFGDDIILPRWAAPRLLEVLDGCGLVVNRAKTCLQTLVKESCGAWILKGQDVPLVRFKTIGVQTTRSWISYLSNSRRAAEIGLLALSTTMTDICRSMIPRIPERYNRMLQRWEFRVPTLCKVGSAGHITGNAGLYAWFTGNDTTPFLHGTVRVKRRWVPDAPYMDVGEACSMGPE